MALKILLIEDDLADQQIFSRYLKRTDVDAELIIAKSISESLTLISELDIELAFCDYNLPDGTAINFLDKAKQIREISTVVVTSQGQVEMATETLKKGAFDYITKDNINPAEIVRIINNADRSKHERELRKKLEARLQRSYLDSNAILENSKNNIWSLDVNGKLLIINERAINSFSHHLGIHYKQGDPFFEKLPNQYSERWIKLFNEVLQGKDVKTVEEFHDGNKNYYLQVDVNPIKDIDVVSGAIFFLTDVTDIHNSRTLLEESEKNFRAIFEGSEVAIMVEDLSNNRIIDLNQSCADLHEYKISDMIGMSIFDTIPPDYLDKSQMNYRAHLKGDIADLDSFAYTARGESIPVNIEVNQIMYNGKECNLLFLQDISLRKETESKLQEAKESAEQSAEFKSTFLANMSHEIRTPMNAMIGFTRLLEGSDLNQEQTEYIEIIRKSGEDLMIIIDDILDISKIQAGKLEIREQAVDLLEILKKCIHLHKYKADDKGISLSLKNLGEIPLSISADPTRLSQVLNNLVSNAIKFTQKGGVLIEVCPKRIENERVEIEFKVIDSGIGIPKKQINNVFNDFAQVDSSVQREHHGTGLGLTIVKHLTELMNGKISLESTPDVGSTFKVVIPFKILDEVKQRKNQSSIDPPTDQYKGIKLLLVEDNKVNMFLAERTIAKLNVTIEKAENGKIAVDKAKVFKPDIIFMDIQMPIMDGIEATQEIRKFSDVAIIAMTAHVLDKEKQKCYDAGMNGFIPKPFKLSDITNVLDNAKSSEGTTIIGNDPIAKLGFPNLTDMADGDTDFVDTLFTTFIENSLAEKDQLIEAGKAGDYEQIRHLAHKLKTPFIVFEFHELKILSDELEANPNDQEKLDLFVRQLANAVDLIKESKISLAQNLT